MPVTAVALFAVLSADQEIVCHGTTHPRLILRDGLLY